MPAYVDLKDDRGRQLDFSLFLRELPFLKPQFVIWEVSDDVFLIKINNTEATRDKIMWAYLYRVAKKVLQREERGREEKKDLQELVYMVFPILDFSVCVHVRACMYVCAPRAYSAHKG